MERPSGLCRQDGFTLIEVMVALLVVTVGLMGVQASGVIASRTLAMADQQTRYTTRMAHSLESALAELRRGGVPAPFCEETKWGDQIWLSVDFSGAPLAAVSVRMTRPGADPAMEFAMRGAVFLPDNHSFPVVGEDREEHALRSGGGCA
ncbi:MAG: prepilin-type N-terminal cleavage/methylation domain-containing protein [Gemmatimonadota bacterium]|nr:prepilin-type N-terminal cleavage/methylation domain-containing protein [Gemmatimonadota bacterium]